MIYVEMDGRLGNQMFRYAAAKALQQLYYPGETICIGFYQINVANKADKSFYNALKDLNISNYEIFSKSHKVISKANILQKAITFPYYIRLKAFKPEEMRKMFEHEKKWHRVLGKMGMYWYRVGYCPFEKAWFRNKFLTGSFESPQYFDEIRDILLEEFMPKYPLIEKNKKLYDLIQKKNSVCISVRRGDFESNEKVKKLHSVCHRSYFENAIKRMMEINDNVTFFMFSDDIEWVKKNIDTEVETYFEDGTDPVWEKLRLMSACKHFIISNSTFSWWAQYLSRNEDKIVISPNRWFNNDYKSPLISKDWELLEL